jgi:anti-sigma regulatory factor (Ser/Thr protein kinase)
MSSESRSNGGAPSGRLEPIATATSGLRREATIECLTDALGQMRRGAAALKAENRQLRAEVGELRTAAQGRDNRETLPGEFGELAVIALPAGSRAPGAARQVLAHCLPRLVTPEILSDSQLLATELVTNSMRHGELAESETVVVRIYLAADRLRLEIENPRTTGVVATRVPDLGGGFGLELVELLASRWGVRRGRSTTVWFEIARA